MIFFNMMQRIGDEMQASTGALSLPGPSPEILDLCMAPGGYSASALKCNPSALVAGLTLHPSLGGHQILIPYGRRDLRVDVLFTDITMLATELGVEDIPEAHPEFASFSHDRLWAGRSFDLVFCDGQVLRAHKPYRASYREPSEATRLTCSQLSMAMQRIKPGGTFIMLLHKIDSWRTIKLLSQFDSFAQIELFKPLAAHRTRGSFYLIAKNVQPHQPEALVAIEEWKVAWKMATLRPLVTEEPGQSPDSNEQEVRDGQVARVLASFGEKLIVLGELVWQIQSNALKEAPWCKNEEAKARDESARADLALASNVSGDSVELDLGMRSLDISN